MKKLEQAKAALDAARKERERLEKELRAARQEIEKSNVNRKQSLLAEKAHKAVASLQAGLREAERKALLVEAQFLVDEVQEARKVLLRASSEREQIERRPAPADALVRARRTEREAERSLGELLAKREREVTTTHQAIAAAARELARRSEEYLRANEVENASSAINRAVGDQSRREATQRRESLRRAQADAVPRTDEASPDVARKRAQQVLEFLARPRSRPDPRMREAEAVHRKTIEALKEARAAELAAERVVARVSLAADREALAKAIAERRGLAARAKVLSARVRSAERAHGERSEEYRRANLELEQAREELGRARQREQGAQVSVAAKLPDVVGDPALDIAELDARYPIALFPVRIETRFMSGARGASELRVRIYPDEILANTHEPRLTRDEAQAGQAFWTTAWDPAKEQEAWSALVTRFPPQRAAWIVQTMIPGNVKNRTWPPQFPAAYGDPSAVPENYTQTIEAMLLPDRWLVLCYRGGKEVHRAVSSPVREPLALNFTGDVPDSDLVDVSGDGLKLDRDVLWTIDFASAEQAGMAVRVGGLTTDDLEQGFDRVLVLGVKSSVDPAAATDKVTELFFAHRYGCGMEVLRQGTATNNTGASTAEYPPKEDAATSFARGRKGLALNDESDGNRLLRAFGLRDADVKSLAPYIAGADRTEERNARAMMQALWPATWGYALEQMMDPAFSESDIQSARDFVFSHVRGRGPLPALRVGIAPYGVLPVTTITRWQPQREAKGSTHALPDVLRRLKDIWLAQTSGVPRVGRTPDDPDKDLVETLGLDASAREVRVRPAFGVDFYRNLFGLFDFADERWADWATRSWWKAREALTAIGQPEWDTRLLGVIYDERTSLFNGPLVTGAPLSETDTLQPNYIHWVATASVDDLRNDRMPEGTPTALLYLMLRHAALLTYGNAAFELHQRYTGEPVDRREMELVGIVQDAKIHQTVLQRLDAQIPELDGMPVKVFVRTQAGREAVPELASYQQVLSDLENLPTAELERLFSEAIDVCSYRLDAWITALASARLQLMRKQQAEGTYFGAFAWAEDLRRASATQRLNRTLADGRTFPVQVGSGGHVHAPSLPHAAAAAVLRNAYLSRLGSSPTQRAIDLSSARVRRALWLLDAVNNGQPISAVFGYLIERWLDERQLQVYKEPLRQLYPMPGLVPPPPGASAEAISARDVVNGWAFYQAPQPLAGLTVAAGDLPKLQAIVSELQEVADAVADLLTADSVYQIVSGGTASAASTLDALSKGARPPEPAISKTPRGGTALTYRIAVVLDSSAGAALGGGWASTARAQLEPALNAWVAQLLGNLTEVRCRTTYLNPQPSDPEHRDSLEVRLSQLSLAPLDVLALAQGAEAVAAASVLDALIAYQVLATAPPASDVRITYEADPAWDRNTVRTFPEILEIARAINEVLSCGRPLRPEDLLLPENASAVQPADRRAAEAATRADNVRDALVQARDNLVAERDNILSGAAADLDALRAVLLATSQFGIGGAVPQSRKGTGKAIEKQLLGQTKSVLREIGERLLREAVETDPARRVSVVFAGSVVFVPQFNVVGEAELAQAIGAAAGVAGSPLAPRKWLQRVARIRPVAWRWRRLGLYASSLGTPVPAAEVVQLPYTAGARWVALPFQSPADRPPSGRISITLHRPTVRPLNAPWAGILIDEWSEIIPNTSELTGLAFHYDDPGAEAAQAILLAVPPTGRKTWDLESLIATLHESFDLARIRAVEPDLLDDVAQFFPAIFLAANAEKETIETDFSGRRIGDPKIVAQQVEIT